MRQALPLRGIGVFALVAVAVAMLYLVRVDRAEPAAGWKLVFQDDFQRSTLGTQWSQYSGVPRGDHHSRFAFDLASVDGQKLRLASRVAPDGITETGGVSNWHHSRLYGKWEVRFRADSSDDVTFHFLLWPKNEHWPPEIDFAENFGGDRGCMSAFLHWRDGGGRQKAESEVCGDFRSWNTVGVEWIPGVVRYTLNGRVWASQAGSHVPSTPMWLGLQAQAGGCAKRVENGLVPCPHVGSPVGASIEIDWVKVWAPSTLE